VLHARGQIRHDALNQVDDAAVFRLVIDANGRVLLGQQIAQQLADEALLAVDDGGRAHRLHLLANLQPDLMEVRQIVEDVLLRAPRSGRADDDAAREVPLLAELADDAAQAAPLVARVDLPRDADVVDGGHEHQEASRQGRMRRDARALGAQRLLDHLDQDLLAFLQELVDFGLGAAIAAAPVGATAARVLVVGVVFVVLERLEHVRHVEERVAVEADVNEGRLHAGQHFRHPALVDVARDPARSLALDEDLGNLIVLEDGHARLVAVRGDNHLPAHAQNSRLKRE
jgi:hypothetical protein